MVIRRALAESRPWLLASLLAGISYYLVRNGPVPGVYLIGWKGLAVGFLAVYAMVRHHSVDARLMAAALFMGALGDMAIEVDLIGGAVCFLIGHIIAIILYARHRREALTFSQRLFAFFLVPGVTFIAWMLPEDRTMALAIAGYTLFLAVMAAMAWTSNFPRYRVGTGALLFVLSDLMIFARLGPLGDSAIPDLTIWPLYYFGQFLIATGVVQSLRHRDPRIAA